MVPCGFWRFLVVSGGSWWFFALCCLAESQCIPTLWFQDAHEINETSRIDKKLRNCWFWVVTGCFWWFLVVLGRLCRSSKQMIQLDHRTYQKCRRAWDFSDLGRLCRSSTQMIKLDHRTYKKCWCALDFSDLGRLFRSSMLP